MSESNELPVEALVARVFETLDTWRDRTREERVEALTNALREPLRSRDEGEREELLQALERRFPCQATDDDRTIAKLEKELEEVRAERDRLAAQLKELGSDEMKAFLVEQVTLRGAARPQFPPAFEGGRTVCAILTMALEILDVFERNVNESLRYVESDAKLPSLRQILGRAIEMDDLTAFGEELKRMRSCLKTFISHPFAFLHDKCRDLQDQFQPDRFLDQTKRKPARAFEAYEEFMARTQFMQEIFPPLKATLRHKLADLMRATSNPGSGPREGRDDAPTLPG